MNATLRRTEKSRDGLFGQLHLPNHRGLILCTMEDDEDAIPAATYACKRTIYHKHGYETFEVTGVLGRSRILFHPANTEEDVEGCIGVGMRRGALWVHDEDRPNHPLALKQAIVASREAFERLMDRLMEVDEFTLMITNAFPE